MKRIWIKDTIKKKSEKVKVSGWISSVRSHGKIIFADLRDFSGSLQLVFVPSDKETYEKAKRIRSEWVVEVGGKISERPENMFNDKIETGRIELSADNLNILSEAENIPFSIEGLGFDISEEKRMKYRYIDLRRERLKKNLIERQKIIQFIRSYLQERSFVEVETPIITKSTPEGARDFVIP